MSGLISLLSNNNHEWITKPHLICEHLLTEAKISINLKCYDNNEIESLAKQRTDWIAEHHKKLQEEEE